VFESVVELGFKEPETEFAYSVGVVGDGRLDLASGVSVVERIPIDEDVPVVGEQGPLKFNELQTHTLLVFPLPRQTRQLQFLGKLLH